MKIVIEGDFRVLYSGCWSLGVDSSRVVNRNFINPSFKYAFSSFRITRRIK